MDTERDDMEQVDAFHRGELSAAEEQALRERIVSDEDFASRVAGQERFLRQVDAFNAAERREFRERQAAKQPGGQPSEAPKQPAKIRPLRWWASGVAAALLIGVVVVFAIIPALSQPAGPVAHFTPLNRLETRLGPPSTPPSQGFTDNGLKDAYDAYDRGDYAAAAPTLTTPLATEVDPLNQLFGAVAQLGLGEGDAAAVTLGTLRGTDLYPANAAEIDFYLALAYLDTGKRRQAIDLLRQTATKGGIYGEEAERVLVEIEK